MDRDTAPGKKAAAAVVILLSGLATAGEPCCVLCGSVSAAPDANGAAAVRHGRNGAICPHVLGKTATQPDTGWHIFGAFRCLTVAVAADTGPACAHGHGTRKQETRPVGGAESEGKGAASVAASHLPPVLSQRGVGRQGGVTRVSSVQPFAVCRPSSGAGSVRTPCRGGNPRLHAGGAQHAQQSMHSRAPDMTHSAFGVSDGAMNACMHAGGDHR